MRPLDLGPRSSDEYDPIPPSPVVVEAARRAREAMSQLVRSGAVSRRELLMSAAASAAVLSALSACSSEERAASGTTAPGGSFDVSGTTETSVGTSSSTTIDPAAASSVLDRDDLVMDVQLHFLDPARNAGDFGRNFPQAACGRRTRSCASRRTSSSTSSSVRATPGSACSPVCPSPGVTAPLAIDVMEHASESLAAQGSERRLLLQAPVFPATGPLQAALDGMAADAATYPVAAWKTYTHAPDAVPARRRAGRRAAVTSGRARASRSSPCTRASRARRRPRRRPMSGRPRPRTPTRPSSCTTRAGSPTRPKARTRPTCPRSSNAASTVSSPACRRAGIGPNGNVYAELGSTWFNLTRNPRCRGARARQAADLPRPRAHPVGHRLHLVRLAAGSDRRVPEPSRSASEFQEQFGYPALTDEAKALILGGNAARLYNVA